MDQFTKHRASTNKAAIKYIKEQFADVNICMHFFCFHTLSNARKKFLGDKGSASYADNFRKIFQQAIQYSGKARDCVSQMLGETIPDAGEVSISVKFK